jgi:hypothetical protein
MAMLFNRLANILPKTLRCNCASHRWPTDDMSTDSESPLCVLYGFIVRKTFYTHTYVQYAADCEVHSSSIESWLNLLRNCTAC